MVYGMIKALKPSEVKDMRRKIVAYSCIIISTILLVLLALSVWAIQAKGYVFFQEYLPYSIMSLIVILYLVGWFLFVGDPDHKKNLVLLISFALLIVVVLYGTLKVKRLKYISVNEDFSHSMMLRYSDKKDLLDIYERKYFILAKKIKTLKHVKVLGDIKWIDCKHAILRYEHQSGAKCIEPISFVQSKIEPNKMEQLFLDNWSSNDRKVQVQADTKGIHIIWDGINDYLSKEEVISNDDGTIVLSYMGNTKYFIYPNDDFKQNQDGTWKKGSLQIAKVKEKDFELVSLKRVNKQEVNQVVNEKAYQELQNRYGNFMQLEMQQILLRDPTLSTYDDSHDYWQGKLQSTHDDCYEIAFLMMKQIKDNQHFLEKDNCSGKININEMTVLAGDKDDFLIELKGTHTSSCKVTKVFQESYRIMKGNQAYLGRQIAYDVNGSYGLSIHDKKEIHTCNKHYEYYSHEM